MNRSILYIFLFILAISCRKYENELYADRRSSVIIGPTQVISASSRTCTIKLRYAISPGYNPNSLLSGQYFSFDTLGGGFILDSTLIILHIKEMERKITETRSDPFSLFFLMDKSITTITNSFNADHLLNFETNFYNTFSKANNYEFCSAVYANDNEHVQDSFQIIGNGFQPNITKLGLQNLSFLFDVNMNKGSADFAYALNRSLDYCIANASYDKKVLLVFTDPNSVIEDNKLLTDLTAKALNNHIQICLYNTLYPDRVIYSQIALCSRTGGYYFGLLASNISNQLDVIFPMFLNIIKGGSVYESTFELSSPDDDFFNKISWCIPDIYIEFVDHSIGAHYIIYETP
jgi:hypothetical protein